MTVEFDISSISSAVERAVAVGLKISAEKVKSDAVKSILNGPKTGRIYKRNTITHQASAPGEPPANDTGNLARNITATVVSPNEAIVNSGAAYARHLEYGTTNIAQRPYMRPALMNNEKFINDTIREQVMRVV